MQIRTHAHTRTHTHKHTERQSMITSKRYAELHISTSLFLIFISFIFALYLLKKKNYFSAAIIHTNTLTIMLYVLLLQLIIHIAINQ